jgi:hypothetical protein
MSKRIQAAREFFAAIWSLSGLGLTTDSEILEHVLVVPSHPAGKHDAGIRSAGNVRPPDDRQREYLAGHADALGGVSPIAALVQIPEEEICTGVKSRAAFLLFSFRVAVGVDYCRQKGRT